MGHCTINKNENEPNRIKIDKRKTRYFNVMTFKKTQMNQQSLFN